MNAPQTATSAATEAMIASLHAKLTEYDMYVVVDGSGSMAKPYMVGKTKSRWDYQAETLQTVVKKACEIDSDGIGVVFFNDGHIHIFNNVTPDKTAAIFAGKTPNGGTPTAKALQTAFEMAGATDKKDLIIFFTDGEPDNEQAVFQTIVAQSQKQQKDNDCTVLFIQVGDDPDATSFLQKLDDDLVGKHGAKFDIVDVKTISEVNASNSFEELLANAIID